MESKSEIDEDKLSQPANMSHENCEGSGKHCKNSVPTENVPTDLPRYNSTAETDVLSPLLSETGDRSPHYSSSPNSSNFNIYMQLQRRGQQTEAASPPPHSFVPIKVPKDPIQPKEGSLLSIHTDYKPKASGNDEDDEERDTFDPRPRARSQTNPETLRQRRHIKCRLMNRPPTPPPGDLAPPSPLTIFRLKHSIVRPGLSAECLATTSGDPPE